MAYYYVKSGGTATGDAGRYVSQQTGSFASLGTANYYDSMEDASNATTAPTTGDYILVSDVHNHTSGTASTFFDSGGLNAGLFLVSVDDTAIDAYKPGAYEERTNAVTYSFQFNGVVGSFGISYGGATIEVLRLGGITTGGIYSLSDGYVKPAAMGDIGITLGSANAPTCLLVNIDIDATNSAGVRALNITASGGRFFWYGGSVINNTGVFGPSGIRLGTDGNSIYCKGVDLSNCATTSFFSHALDDTCTVTLDNCQLPVGFTAPTLSYQNHTFEMYNCDDATGDDYHRFLYKTGAGEVKNNDSTYVTATTAWYEGSKKSSIEVITDSACSKLRPFIFELPAQYVDFANTDTDVITVDLITTDATSAITLTDVDIFAYLVYPDGTTAVQPNWLTSAPTIGAGNFGFDPLAAGTTLSTSSLGASDWTGELASTNYYKITLDTSSDAGQATIASIRFVVTKPSIASGELYIHPLMTLS